MCLVLSCRRLQFVRREFGDPDEMSPTLILSRAQRLLCSSPPESPLPGHQDLVPTLRDQLQLLPHLKEETQHLTPGPRWRRQREQVDRGEGTRTGREKAKPTLRACPLTPRRLAGPVPGHVPVQPLPEVRSPDCDPGGPWAGPCLTSGPLAAGWPLLLLPLEEAMLSILTVLSATLLSPSS